MSFWKRIRRYRRDCYNEAVVPEPAPFKELVKEIEAQIQVQPAFATGVLDPRSQTWLFIHSWAQERLDKTRARNDSANADIIQTSVMRGEIKVLKELISLPAPKPGRGLLDED